MHAGIDRQGLKRHGRAHIADVQRIATAPKRFGNSTAAYHHNLLPPANEGKVLLLPRDNAAAEQPSLQAQGTGEGIEHGHTDGAG